MTTTHDATTPTLPDVDRGSRLPGLLGGASLALAPIVLVGAAATSPPQADSSTAAYVASLAEDPTLTAISATLFHYSWVLFAFGALAALGLVRGRRGRGLAMLGGIAAAFGSIQMTGLLYNDWVLSEIGNRLPQGLAVEVAEGIWGDPHVTVWQLSAKVCALLGFPLLYAGLARAGVINWWLVPVSLFTVMGYAFVPGVVGLVLGLAFGAPAYVTGLRLVQRARLHA